MERLLVTGVDFPLGSNLALTLADRCEVLGVCSHQAIELSGVSTASCAAAELGALAQIAVRWQPQWIVHCGPLAASSWDSDPPADAMVHEPGFGAGLAQMAHEIGARLTVISSDVVFCGPRMFHDESSTAGCGTARAIATRSMERALENGDTLVVRTHAYGWSPVPAHAGFAERAYESLSGGSSRPADGRHYATPILATDLAELLWRAYELRLHGLHHLSGAERCHACRFVAELAMACGLPLPAPIVATEGKPADGHDETSLNSKRARRLLEMPTPLVREGLDRFAAQARGGWRDRWQSGQSGAGKFEIAA